MLEKNDNKKPLKEVSLPDRKIKVYSVSDRNYNQVSQIRLQGKWIEELGFEPGAPIVVKCEAGKVTLMLE